MDISVKHFFHECHDLANARDTLYTRNTIIIFIVSIEIQNEYLVKLCQQQM
jgi:hypothetical protein